MEETPKYTYGREKTYDFRFILTKPNCTFDKYIVSKTAQFSHFILQSAISKLCVRAYTVSFVRQLILYSPEITFRSNVVLASKLLCNCCC